MAFNDAFSPYETDQTGDESGTDRRFVGIRKCVLLASQIEGLRSLFDPAFGNSQVWPGRTGLFAPVLKKYALHKMDAARWELTLQYFEPEPWEVTRPTVAVLYAKVSGKVARILRERVGDKRLIEGPCAPRMVNGANADAGKVWVVLNKGANVDLEPETELTVHTASETMRVPDESDRIGKVNSADLPNVINAKKGTLRFDGTSFTGKLVSRQYWHIVYQFRWNPDGWSNACEVAKHKVLVTRQPVMDNSVEPAATVGFTRVVTLEPEVDVNNNIVTETRDLTRGEADFSDINGWLAWV